MFNDVIKHLLPSSIVPTHVVFFIFERCCLGEYAKVFGIRIVFSVLPTQVKLGLQMEARFKPISPFPNFLARDNMQHFWQPY